MQKLQEVQVNISLVLKQLSKASQLRHLLNLKRCLYFEHIVQSHHNTCLVNVRT